MLFRSILILILLATSAYSQSTGTVLDIEILARESLKQYTFKRNVVLQTIDSSGHVSGEIVRNSIFVFDDLGNRIETGIEERGELKGLRITKEDWQDLRDAQLLGLDTPGKYDLVPEEGSIAVRSKVAPDARRMSERYFLGHLWVNPAGQILRVRGIVEPAGKQRFAWFDTYRGEVGAPYPFPVKTEADDILHFPDKDIRYRISVRYYDYRKFKSEVVITEPQPDREMSFNTKMSKGGPENFFPRWKQSSRVEVYSGPGFTADQVEAIKRALTAWSTSLFTLQYMGEGEGQLTIRRQNVLSVDGKHFAYFKSWSADGLLERGEIFIDHRTIRPEAIESVVAHELGHSMGLSDCKDCKSVMRGFSSVNRSNGHTGPSSIDTETLRMVAP